MSDDDTEIHDFVEAIRFDTFMVPATREILRGELKDLFEYWNTLRESHFAPSWSSFDWDRVPPRLVPHCAVVKVSRNPLDFVYCHWGIGRAIMQRGDYTGKSVREFKPKRIAEKAIREYCEVIAQNTAICVQTENLARQGGEAFDYQFLRLPFTDNGQQVHDILGVGLYDESVMKRAMAFYRASPEKDIDLDAMIKAFENAS